MTPPDAAPPEWLDRSGEVLRFLDGTGIPYRLLRHAPVATIADCLKYPEISAPGNAMARNLFLCNRQGTEFYLLLVSPLRSFRTAVVSKLLGVSRLSFAPETLLPGMLGLLPGAVSPLGLLFDTQRKVRLAVDAALTEAEYLWFHPCVNTASLRVTTDDFLRCFLPAIGRAAEVIGIPD